VEWEGEAVAGGVLLLVAVVAIVILDFYFLEGGWFCMGRNLMPARFDFMAIGRVALIGWA
jgi:hypothetical protein